MPRRKCNTCKKGYRRKRNTSHNVTRGGMEGPQHRQQRPTPEWWDLAVEGVSISHRKHIKEDAVFVSFTQGIDVAAQKRFIDAAVFLSPMFETSYKFDCDTPHSVIVASNTPLVRPLTFAYFCEDIISFNMYPFDLYAFGRRAPQRINLFIKYHDNAITHEVVPIQEHYTL